MVKNILNTNKIEDKFDVTDALSLAIAHSYIMKSELNQLGRD
jgi:Holliday junction resolvasome RuvABC endonuclease subunit